jgi:O-antigen/teichoic acid export membrane protein
MRSNDRGAKRSVAFLKKVTSRFGWGLADQSLSSLTNFGLGILAARSLDPRQFGAFTIAFSVYAIALSVSRVIASEPLMIRFSAVSVLEWRKGAAAATGTALLVAFLIASACAVAAAFLGGPLASAFLALGIMMPGLLLQDAWRFAFFASRRGGAAFANDLVWTVLLAVFVSLLIVSDMKSISAFLVVWGGSGSIAGVVGIVQARVVPSPSRATWWFRGQADLIPRFLGELGVSTLATQLTVFAIGAVAGLAAVGAIRAAQLLLGPLNVIYMGIGLIAVPTGARALVVSSAKLKRLCATWSTGLAACALAVGVTAAVLPDSFGTALLGQNWSSAQSLILPVSIWMAGFGVVLGAGVGLRVLAAARLSLRARMLVAPLMVVSAVGGAALYGARGAAWGLAAVYPIGSIVWWRYFYRGLREYSERLLAERASGAGPSPPKAELARGSQELEVPRDTT